jgi:hypothetical protein
MESSQKPLSEFVDPLCQVTNHQVIRSNSDFETNVLTGKVACMGSQSPLNLNPNPKFNRKLNKT